MATIRFGDQQRYDTQGGFTEQATQGFIETPLMDLYVKLRCSNGVERDVMISVTSRTGFGFWLFDLTQWRYMLRTPITLDTKADARESSVTGDKATVGPVRFKRVSDGMDVTSSIVTAMGGRGSLYIGVTAPQIGKLRSLVAAARQRQPPQVQTEMEMNA